MLEIFGLRSGFKLNQPQGEKKDLSRQKMVKNRVHIWVQ